MIEYGVRRAAGQNVTVRVPLGYATAMPVEWRDRAADRIRINAATQSS